MPKTSKAAPSRKKAAPKGTAAAGGSSKTEPKNKASSPAKKQPATAAAGKKAAAKKAAAKQPEKTAAKKVPPAKKAPASKKALAEKPAPEKPEKPAPEKPARPTQSAVAAPATASRPGALRGRSAGAAGAAGGVKKAAPPPLDRKFLEDQRDLLLSERRAYAEQAVALKAEADQLAAEMEPGDVQFDEESGEGDSIGMERERDLQLAGQARAAIEEIDRALAKVEAGAYGLCERCGQPIPKPRLKALPYAALCVACKSGGLASRR